MSKWDPGKLQSGPARQVGDMYGEVCPGTEYHVYVKCYLKATVVQDVERNVQVLQQIIACVQIFACKFQHQRPV
ncbi:hypothetical protein DPMN_115658 [Dreissena polymorpha]|uniref:Uncharacterized protein n=1 Tax=Dreissena polymorpha TaxID=45954 RepID=A0A9D4KMC0_DREPO|nr:hypothetical protein DPMN_115658 [Dreissena polymorpha]